MPRYFFHILSAGETIPDEEGMELTNVMAAHQEALASARDLALQQDRNDFGRETRSVQIVDAAGAILHSVPVLGDGKGRFDERE